MTSLINVAAYGITIFVIIPKILLYLRRNYCKSLCRLNGKTALITGSNTGIGKEVALDFAKRDARVILACRNESKGKQAVLDIIRQTGNENVRLEVADVSKMSSVRELANKIQKEEKQLDLLINNAGIANSIGEKPTEDGFNLTWATNYLGHFLLTDLLLELLKSTPGSRVVNVSSIMNFTGHLSPLTADGGGQWFDGIVRSKDRRDSYGSTKLAQILHMKYLTSKYSGSMVKFISCHPGAVYTAIYDRLPRVLQFINSIIASIYYRDAVLGAQTVIHCAVDESVSGGEYYSNCSPAWVKSSQASDWRLAEQLYSCTKQILETH